LPLAARKDICQRGNATDLAQVIENARKILPGKFAWNFWGIG